MTASTPTRIVTNFFIALNWRLSFTRHIQRPWSPRLAWDDGDDDDDDDGDDDDDDDDNGDNDDDESSGQDLIYSFKKNTLYSG